MTSWSDFAPDWSRTQEIFEQNPLPTLIIDDNLSVVFANPASHELLQCEPGSSLIPGIHPKDQDKARTLFQSPKLPHGIITMRVGRPSDWRFCIAAVQVWPPSPKHRILTLTDATQEVTTLRERKALLDAGSRIQWSTWSYYPDTGTHVHTAKIREIFTGDPQAHDDVISHDQFLAHVHPDDRQLLDKTVRETFLTGSGYRLEYRVINQNGAIRWVHSIGTQVMSLVNDRPYLMGILIDVTRDHQRAQVTDRMERLEALRLFASGIAHDLNNQLTIISGLLALMDGTVGPDLAETYRFAEEALSKVQALARRMMDVARDTPASRQTVHLASIMGPLHRWVSRQGVTMTLELDHDVVIEGDPVGLTQVVENILRNAVEALSGDGHIRVQSRSSWNDQSGAVTELTFDDNGPGVPPKLRNRLFDPYFTTKTGGHGLGLASVHAIIHQHGGTIVVEDSPAGGARFRVTLPIVSSPRPPS